MTDAPFIVGATGRCGAAVCRRLAESGLPYVPVIRSVEAWRALGLPGERRVVDLADVRTLADVLSDARLILCCAPAGYLPGLLAVTDPDIRLIALAGPIRYSRAHDGDGLGERAGEAAFLSSGRRGVLLHPAYLYGRASIARLLARLRGARMLALPGGGRRVVQPVLEDDVVEALIAAAGRDWPGPRNMVAAGPRAMRFDAFLTALATAAGLPAPRIVGLPGMLAGVLGGGIPVPDEDQAHPVEPLANLLGHPATPPETGLQRCLS